ncbi:hypothetical protein FRC11_005993 [Ceratobasidium sp. 423]|nr:hypothetical protein FRC11_005993 [Ceratobasidium sp. 423]
MHKKTLINSPLGEHITEMLIWGGDWIHGLQFITNLGRCSPHFGGSGPTPTLVRSKGGVLVGALSLMKRHEYGRLFHKIQGIWRHDIVNKVPKEDDAFSDYFGSKSKGRSFNDRVVVRNSGMAISKVKIRCCAAIDSIQFTYVNNTGPGQSELQTERHGGLGGSQRELTLDPGEHITSITGWYDNVHERISELRFVTNQGRDEAFGEGKVNDKSHRISALAPRDKDGKLMRLQYICGKR